LAFVFEKNSAIIIGLGGAGGNALEHIYQHLEDRGGINYLAISTDRQALHQLKIS
jgi:cell division GTPase FtsZ